MGAGQGARPFERRAVRAAGGNAELAVVNGDVAASRGVSEGQVVPFLNLAASNERVASAIMPMWSRILESAGFIGGEFVAAFEQEFAAFTGTREAVGVANGTDAITIALLAMGVEPRDEVIVPAHTFVATVEAVRNAGAQPVLVDVDPDTGTMDPAAAEAALTSSTKVIMPVHLYGQAADMGALRRLADREGLGLLEDAAQAHGATYQGEPVGSLGDAAAFSFYPGKNLGACGDAGAITTSSPAIAERARVIRDHGQSEKYLHVVSGFNSRLDAIQAAALLAKLPHLPEWNSRRAAVAEAYRRGLSGSSLELPAVSPDRTHVFHLYVVRHADRDRLKVEFEQRGIQVGLHYPTPVHLQPAFASLGYLPGAFPSAERWAAQCLSLPMCPELTSAQIDRVMSVAREVA